MEKEYDVIVIGAGLTGLTTAYYLRKKGLDVMVLEQDNRTGGSIHTLRHDGFIYESGPNTGALSTAEMAELFRDLAPLCELEIAQATAGRRMILKNGRFNPLPSGLWQAVTTPLFRFRDKLRILGEPFRRKGADPMESVGHLVLRRMGQSFLDYAIDPFIGGIYAGDPMRLTTRYALPKLWALEQNYGSFVKGAIRKSREPKTERDKLATKEVVSAVGGLQSLTDALTQKIGVEYITLRAGEVSVTPQGKQWRTSAVVDTKLMEWRSRYVISTVGAHALPALLGFLDAHTLNVLNNVAYAKIVQISLGFRKWEGMPLNSFGGLVPFKENRDILGILFMSSFMQNRAPEGGALLNVFMGGIRKPEYSTFSDQEITEKAISEIRKLLRWPEAQPDMVHIFRHPHAIPQYGENTGERLEMIERIQQQYPGLVIAGNLRDGIGMASRIQQGREVADKII